MLTLALVPVLALHISLPPQPPRPDARRYHIESENDDVRVARVVLAPGERVTAGAPSGSVIVYLTAGLDGRMPPADAAWQAPGTFDMENRGPARFEAIVVQFKRTVRDAAMSTTAPAGQPYAPMQARAPLTAWAGYGYGRFDGTYRERVKSDMLVNGPAVTATRVRVPGSMYLDPARVDPAPRVVVYLRGGYAWPDAMESYGDAAMRVRRGDVRVLPANTPYTLSNAGSDPGEFIVIAQR